MNAAGDIFESDGKNVYKILKGSSTSTLVASGFTKITGMIVDPEGDIIVADALAAKVKKILASDGSISTLISGESASDVALDGAGNLYLSDHDSNVIHEFPVVGPEIDTELSFLPDLFSVDAAGDIFIGSGENVYDIPANGGAHYCFRIKFHRATQNGLVVTSSGIV